MRRNVQLLAGTALLNAISCADSLAQQPARSETSTPIVLEEILVTANKRVESLQDVAMSISAFTRDFFQDTGETNFNALEQYTPGLKIQSGPDTRTTSIRIRGIGSTGSNTGIDPSVGVFIDGVYQGRAGMNISDLTDIERVEVLRGPQGSLYGKNTAAGAINVITRQPITEFEALTEVSYDNNDQAALRATLNIPFGDTGNAARLSAFGINGDHIYVNTFNGEGLNDANKWGLRSRLLFNFEESTLLINADYSRENTDCCAMAVIDYHGYSPFQIGTPMTNSPSAELLIPGVDYRPLESVSAVGSPPAANPFGDRYWLNHQPSNDVEVSGLSADWSFDLANESTITFINAARSYRSISSYDGDFSAYDAATPADTEVDLDQFSSELRITSPGGETWDYQAGLYAFYSNTESEGRLGMNRLILENSPPALGVPLGILLGQHSENVDRNEHTTTSLAAFGQLTWNVSSKMSAILGLRITEEKKERTGSQRTLRTPFEPGHPLYIGPTPLDWSLLPDLSPIAGADVDFDQERTDTDVSPSLALRYFWTDDFMTYGSVSRGFKSGGFDQRRVPVQVQGAINGGDDKAGEFDEEQATSYELGWKSTSPQGRLTFNGSLYFIDYKDFQAQAFDGATTKVTNAGSLESYGAEIDVLYQASDKLTLGSAMGYNKAEYKEFDNGQCTAEEAIRLSLVNPYVACIKDLAGEPLDNAPEWTFSSFAQYETHLSPNLVAIARLEHNYVDSYYLDQDLDENLKNDAVNLVNARFTLTNSNRDWEAVLWGKNVLDEEYYVMGIDIPTVGGYAGVVAPAAAYGLTLRLNFR